MLWQFENVLWLFENVPWLSIHPSSPFPFKFSFLSFTISKSLVPDGNFQLRLCRGVGEFELDDCGGLRARNDRCFICKFGGKAEELEGQLEFEHFDDFGMMWLFRVFNKVTHA